eukprot:PhF_6_TR6381/c0_g1_i1/m.9638
MKKSIVVLCVIALFFGNVMSQNPPPPTPSPYGQNVSVTITNNSTYTFTWNRTIPGQSTTVTLDTHVLAPGTTTHIFVHDTIARAVTVGAFVYYDVTPVVHGINNTMLWIFDPQKIDMHMPEFAFGLVSTFESKITKTVWNPNPDPRVVQVTECWVTLINK